MNPNRDEARIGRQEEPGTEPEGARRAGGRVPLRERSHCAHGHVLAEVGVYRGAAWVVGV